MEVAAYYALIIKRHVTKKVNLEEIADKIVSRLKL